MSQFGSRPGSSPGDYFVTSDPGNGLAAIINEIHNAPMFSVTGKRLRGANVRRRRQSQRGTIGGIQRSTNSFWRSHAYSGEGRLTIDVIDCL